MGAGILPAMPERRIQHTYDSRLVQLVQTTGDITIATGQGVPRTTATGRLRAAPRDLVTTDVLGMEAQALAARVVRLERRVRQLLAVLRLLVALLRVLDVDLARRRIPAAADKARLLRAVERSRGVLGLTRALRLIGLSPSRLSAWRRAARACELEDASSCPLSSPQGLTGEEIAAMREMTTSSDFRHVATSRLALLAQRTGRVVASPSTWCRYVRERGWRRPRGRVHPKAPHEGIRATRPDEIWHIDTTLIRLLDGTRAYLHAVVDNYSRRILSWRLSARFEPGVSAELLIEAGRHLVGTAVRPTLLADAGVENRNATVDDVVATGLLRRVIAMTDVCYSNSMIEAFWRTLKHQWLFLNRLDSVETVRKLVAFYVQEHNERIPHAAFRGQTPDEMYHGTGDHVPAELVVVRAAARRHRLEVHRVRTRCSACV